MGPLNTFRELYCEHHGITTQQYERVLLWRSLHRRARPFYWLLRLNRDYSAPDLEFVRGVGALRSRRGFRDEAAEFHYHPKNRGLLRTLLRLRVSSRRLQAIFESEIRPDVTTPPFGTAQKPDR